MALNISPSPSYDGNYTVTWADGCFYTGYTYPYPEYVCTFLTENGYPVTSTSPYYATGRSEGTYQYDVVEEWYYFQQYADSGSVIVGTPPPRDPIPTQLTYQYQTREGDINYDGRVDLFVERTSGGVPGNGVLDKVVLWQSPSGSFWPVVDSYYTSVASSWPASSASTVVDDLNMDGYVDVALKGVPAATGTAYEQIIFSSGAPLLEQPRALRAVDASLTQFAGNALDYAANPSYFANNAAINYYYGSYYYFYCSFSPYYYGMIDGYYYDYGWSCGIYADYFYGYYYDYSIFNAEAVAIWTNESSNEAGAVSNSQSTENVQQAAESVLTVPVGGWPMEEVFGSEGDHTDPDARRGLETFWSILGIARAYEVQPQEAPQQAPRSADTVYITGHKVFGIGPLHTALEYSHVMTISAVTFPIPLIGPYLRSVQDRPRELMNMTLGTVGNGGPALAYWLNLRAADNAYDDDLPYLAFPFGPFYNSNGYTHGLIQFTGGNTSPGPNMMNGFVGGAHYVPAINFQ